MFICGCNDHGQLGLTSNSKSSDGSLDVVIPFLDSGLDVTNISSYSIYDCHAVAIMKNGDAFAAGNDTDYRIIGSLPKQDISNFTKFEIKDNNNKIQYPISAVCGYTYTLYLIKPSKTSNLTRLAYSFKGLQTASPLFLNIGNSKPISIYGGHQTSAAIDSEGAVILIPNTLVLLKSPSMKLARIFLPDGNKAECIACCDHCLYVVGSSGLVFVSEIPKDGFSLKFTIVESLSKLKITEISGVCHHVIALSDSNRVFGCGSNKFGQIGLQKEIKRVSEFTEFLSLRNNKIMHVCAGNSHSLFLSENGQSFGCGTNGCGQLFGIKPSTAYFQIIKLDIKKSVTQFIAGNALSAAFYVQAPVNNPNRRIRTIIEKVSPAKKPPLQPSSLNLEEENARLREENSLLRKENLSINKKNKELEEKVKQLTSLNEKNIYELKILTQSEVDSLNVVGLIGTGSQSEVKKVTKTEPYALKILRTTINTLKSKTSKPKSEESVDIRSAQSLLREYEILHNLYHPNIVRAFGFCMGDKLHAPSILLQFCPHNLSEVVDDMTNFEKVCSIYEICLGMEAVHKAGLIHRDLKPTNILIDSNKHVKVSDFGVSCLSSIESQTQSMTGGIGTLKFMAPELLNECHKYSNKVDVYSFGVVVFFVLTGGEMPKITFAEQVTGKKAKIPSEINDVSRDLINNCWSMKADDRPSFSEIIKFIENNEFRLINGVENDTDNIQKFISS